MTAHAACRGIRDHDEHGSIGSSATRTSSPTSARRSRRRSGRTRTRTRSGAARRPRRRPPPGPAIASLDLDAPRRPTTRATPTATSASCSRRAGGRDVSQAWGDDVVYYRTLARLPQLRGSQARAGASCDRWRLHRLRDRRRADDERLRGDARLPEAGVGARLFPADLAASSPTTTASRASRCSPRRRSRPSRSTATSAWRRERPRARGDAVVAGLGIEPGTDLAAAAGLEVDDGDRRRRARPRRRTRRRVRRRRRRALPGTGARHDDARRARGPREQPRPRSARTWPARAALRPPPVLLLRPLRARLRGRRRGRLAADTVAEWKEPNRAGVVCYVEDGGRAASCSGTCGAGSTRRPTSSARASRSTAGDPRADGLTSVTRRARRRRACSPDTW